MHRIVELSQFSRAVGDDHSHSRLVVWMAGEVLVSRLAPDRSKDVTALTSARTSSHRHSLVHFPELNMGCLAFVLSKRYTLGPGVLPCHCGLQPSVLAKFEEACLLYYYPGIRVSGPSLLSPVILFLAGLPQAQVPCIEISIP